MKKERAGSGDSRGRDAEEESEHEKNRRIKSEQERILRKQLCHLRPVESDDVDAVAARPPRFRD
jgi:hypothetical protein